MSQTLKDRDVFKNFRPKSDPALVLAGIHAVGDVVKNISIGIAFLAGAVLMVKLAEKTDLELFVNKLFIMSQGIALP